MADIKEVAQGAFSANELLHTSDGGGEIKHEDKDIQETFPEQPKSDSGIENNSFKLKLEIGKENRLYSYCQSVMGLGVSREKTAIRSGGDSDHVYYSLGNVTYSDLILKSVFVKDKTFLDWIFSGTSINTIYKGTLTLELEDCWTFTFRDAFPTQWNGLSMKSGGEINIILIESITISYSRMEYNLTKPGSK